MPSCPRCGFDLDAAGECSVCGFGKTGAEPGPQAASGRQEGEGSPAEAVVGGVAKGPAAARRPARLWLLVGAGAVLIAASGVLLLGGLVGGRGAGPQAALQGGKPAVGGVGSAAPSEVADAPAPLPGPAPASGSAPLSATAVAAGEPSTPPSYEIAEAADPPIDNKESYLAWMLANTSEREPYLSQKWERAQIVLGRGDITHGRVLEAFLLTPRESFVRSYNRGRAYADAAMPIGYGQTISGPHLVSRMTNALDPQPQHKVLEIGTGSGYQSAILSELSDYVYTIEIVKPLYEETDALYGSLAAEYPMYRNIHRLNADGYYGWKEHAPFDRIIVTAAIDHIPPDLLKQLAPGGIMVIPVGPPSGQVVLKITKIVEPDGSVRLEREDIYHGTTKKIFVPFTAEGGGVHSLQRDQERDQ